MELLKRPPAPALRGARVTVIGRSPIVGRPVSMLLIAADATVTVCHSKTADLADECRRADVLVVAIGKPNFVTADMVKPGAVVVDVGTNVVNGRLVGDVDASVRDVAGAVTPVPGGVGPVTTAVLLRNIVDAAERQTN
jgi:methylenetetrahydrofolate dehydrogenase (NADP+)/methenyltetrahydrofolate cyclohydrolase